MYYIIVFNWVGQSTVSYGIVGGIFHSHRTEYNDIKEGLIANIFCYNMNQLLLSETPVRIW